jgi:hypothetical protein
MDYKPGITIDGGGVFQLRGHGEGGSGLQACRCSTDVPVERMVRGGKGADLHVNLEPRCVGVCGRDV